MVAMAQLPMVTFSPTVHLMLHCYDNNMVWTNRNLKSVTTLTWQTRKKEMFYLTTHSTHFSYRYMESDIWLRTILIVRKETHCCHLGYSFRLTARVLLYAPSHRQDSTYHGLCYTSRGALANKEEKILFDITWILQVVLPRGDRPALSVSGLVEGMSETLKVYGQENTVSQMTRKYGFPIPSRWHISVVFVQDTNLKHFGGV